MAAGAIEQTPAAHGFVQALDTYLGSEPSPTKRAEHLSCNAQEAGMIPYRSRTAIEAPSGAAASRQVRGYRPRRRLSACRSAQVDRLRLTVIANLAEDCDLDHCRPLAEARNGRIARRNRREFGRESDDRALSVRTGLRDDFQTEREKGLSAISDDMAAGQAIYGIRRRQAKEV
ncbi:MAG: hypothetical protein JOY90_20875 [Bradyrhizobium sp.]|uniref:hypothetical protein n=1 Tax=Bradyrhizobium sp. TaxID=376 RepID=UPI001DEEE72E|nr:hypothetical protein [Bradyrhizobium sp.]MBV9562868.1 hypothetical protein [Bradyrhizobium sp.]